MKVVLFSALCKRCFIYFSARFWVRPFGRLIQHLVWRGENNVFEQLIFWDDELFVVCGTSWSKVHNLKAFWIKTVLTFDWKRRMLLFTLIWFLKFLYLNRLCFLVFLTTWFFLLFFEVLSSTVLKIVAVQADGSVICRTRLTRCCCERCLIFSSLWTFFFLLLVFIGFWIRPFWRLIQNLVRKGENNVLEELIFEILIFFVCGTSWSYSSLDFLTLFFCLFRIVFCKCVFNYLSAAWLQGTNAWVFWIYLFSRTIMTLI